MGDDLRSFVEQVFAHARDNIVLQGEEVIALFFAKWSDGSHHVYFTPWQDEREKCAALDMLRIAFALRGVESYVMVSEVWAIERPAAEVESGMKGTFAGPPPSECPDRYEMLMVTGVSRDGIEAATAKLGYDGDKRTCGDIQWLDSRHGEIGGRMAELLPPADLAPLPPERVAEFERVLGLRYEHFSTVH